MDSESNILVNETEEEEDPKEQSVVFGDGESAISSLAWGDDSLSRFDFSYDARRDSCLQISPATKLRKSLPDVTVGKKKKSSKKEKKDESKSKSKKKRSEKKKKSKKRLDTPVTDLDESDSVFVESTCVLDATEVSELASVADSLSVAERSKSKKKKKKKDESTKSKKCKLPKMKKGKSKKKVVSPETAVGLSERTDEASQKSFVRMEEEGQSDDAAYLPTYLSPKVIVRKSLKQASDVKPGPEFPITKKNTIQSIPDLLSSPVKPAAETPTATTKVATVGIPFLPDIKDTLTTPAKTSSSSDRSRRPDP